MHDLTIILPVGIRCRWLRGCGIERDGSTVIYPSYESACIRHHKATPSCISVRNQFHSTDASWKILFSKTQEAVQRVGIRATRKVLPLVHANPNPDLILSLPVSLALTLTSSKDFTFTHPAGETGSTGAV